MRPSDFRRLKRLAYGEYKVTRQISTGNGETYLADGENPSKSFVDIQLGYGVHERPCQSGNDADGYCGKPCTLDYTLRNLDEINRTNLRELDARDTLSVPARISSVDGDVREHFGLKQAPVVDAYNRVVSQAPAQPRKKLSASDAQKQLRAQARRAGIRIVKGEYVDERAKGWTPGSTTRQEREELACKALGEALAKLGRRQAKVA